MTLIATYSCYAVVYDGCFNFRKETGKQRILDVVWILYDTIQEAKHAVGLGPFPNFRSAIGSPVYRTQSRIGPTRRREMFLWLSTPLSLFVNENKDLEEEANNEKGKDVCGLRLPYGKLFRPLGSSSTPTR